VIYGELMYVLSNQGVLSTYNAKTGERVYQHRVGSGGSYSASPVAGDGKVYLPSEDGDIYVVKAGNTYELLTQNSVGEVVMASPAISDGILIVRGMQHVFAIAAKQ
jgi:outer membrane protein assembly factor BamB